MRYLLCCLLCVLGLNCFAAIQLTTAQKSTLKEICKGDADALKALKKTSDPIFIPFIEQMMGIKDKPETILENKYLQKPDHQELVFWSVKDKLDGNTYADSADKTNENELIETCLLDTGNELVLVYNYYQQLSGRYKFILNDVNMSKMNFQPELLGLKSTAEKAIFFFFLYNDCGVRLQIMSMFDSGKPMSLLKRLGKWNAKDYFYYSDFDFPDFYIMSDGRETSFKKMHLKAYYHLLCHHLQLLERLDKEEEAIILFKNSILSKEEYFEWSGMQQELEGLYGKYRVKN